MVIECKADEKDFDKAMKEACEVYGQACAKAGHDVIAVGIAGQEQTSHRVGVRKLVGGPGKTSSTRAGPSHGFRGRRTLSDSWPLVERRVY